jgi:glycosyltransferase involved in cell wall biosynthesis
MKKYEIWHFYGYTPDIVNFTDEEWIKSECEHGINYAASRLNQEGKFISEVHNFTRQRKRKEYEKNQIKFIFHPVSFRFLPLRISFKRWSWPIYEMGYQYSFSFLRYLKEKKPDLVIFYISIRRFSYLVANFLVKRKIPYLIWFHGGIPCSPEKARRRMFKQAKAIISLSALSLKQIGNYYQLPPARLYHISHGCNVNLFKPLEIKKERKYPHLLYVGRIDQRKGLFTALECFLKVKKVFPDATFKIIGRFFEEKYRQKTIAFIKEHHLTDSVELKDWCSRNELPFHYNQADLLLFPSQKECLGVVLLEAMSCEVPPVALSVAEGPTEIIKNNFNGILTTEQKFNEEVINLLSQPERLKMFKRNCRDFVVREWSFESIYQKFKKLCEDVLT